MFEYTPWSTQTFLTCSKKYLNGDFSILDIELGGDCNYDCVYCDSPKRDEKCEIPFEKLEHILETKKIDWVFICGLGEPTVGANYNLLIKVLGSCMNHRVKCSIFTNLSSISSELKKFLELGVLHLLFKFDSSNKASIRKTYGIPNPKEHIENMKSIEKLVKNSGDLTNIAASIVPTKMNKKEIVPIVKHCYAMGVFPFIGELENSGEAKSIFNDLKLSNDELTEIKMEMEDTLGFSYKPLFCPAVISGIHIDSRSRVVVDEFSGLSCNWFWLKEPKSETVCEFKDGLPFTEIGPKIFSLRNKKFGQVKQYINNHSGKPSIFGGCGGNAISLLDEYLKIHNNCILYRGGNNEKGPF